jgi:hypothetical protein
MNQLRTRLLICLIAILPISASWAETDERTGLVIAPGWQQVAAHCGGCHSHQLVTAQRGDETFWINTIRWMQKTQSLWQLPADAEREIVSYLGEHYSESEWGRRPPLSASLLPATP